MPDSLLLSRAANDHADMEVIIRLIQEAADWLRTQDTDQWARPWPNRAGRDRFIKTAIRQGKTWICWDNETPAATLTADPDTDPYWPPEDRAESAVYVHRLVVSRKYAGTGLGAALLNWAGATARHEHGVQWLRLSAWTTNQRLHTYYRNQGFCLCRLRQGDSYPSAAFFQKPTDHIPPDSATVFQRV